MEQHKLDKLTAERIEFLNKNYTYISTYHLNGNEKIYLGDKENRQCRFCGKDRTQTTFDNEAHAIPEFVGNKKLIAYYECDACNTKFSTLLETHMASYMKLWHTLAQVKGKKGVPSFKTNQKKSRIDLTAEFVKISESVDDVLTEIDEENKTITFNTTRPSYIPIAIYKCLTKMALTIMPEEELGKFKTTMAWINEINHEESPHNLKSLIALFTVAEGVHPYWFVTTALLKRKENAPDNVPYMVFLLAYANYTFQIYLPLCQEDKRYAGGEFSMIYIPTPVDMVEGTGALERKQLDFNGKSLVRGEEVTMQMGFENIIEVPVNPTTDENSE
jgi:hypothetical protein